jgi:E3 ubiquitin-protein ligase HECTD1
VPGSPFAVQSLRYRLQYQSDFDTNGMLYWLGTKGGTQPYVNPVDSNAVTDTASSQQDFAAGRFVQHQSDGQNNYTADKPNSWMAVALGGGAQAKVTRYCLRHGCSGSYYVLRHWDLEASTDGRAWTTLRSHRNDESLAEAGYSTAGWAVEGGKGAFSHFRIRQTGKNSNGGDTLACAGIELYGELLPPAAPV